MNPTTHQVKHKEGITFEVLELKVDKWTPVFEGPITHCEAWVRLREKGYIKD
jgi:hypothetical protein